eukprot:33241-Eustigmatos_ZCMA.PRE.1
MQRTPVRALRSPSRSMRSKFRIASTWTSASSLRVLIIGLETCVVILSDDDLTVVVLWSTTRPSLSLSEDLLSRARSSKST